MSISSRAELNIDLRHDFILILSEKLSDEQAQAIVEDLKSLSFNCDRRRNEESKEWQLLIGLNDHEKILKEAEAQLIMAPRIYADKDKQKNKEERKEKQKSYLPKTVIETEEKKPFLFEFKNEYCGGDFDKILNEAEKSRLIYIILDKIKFSQMTNFKQAISDSKEGYSVL